MSLSDDMHTEPRRRLIAGHYDPRSKLREEHVASASGKDCQRVGRSEVSTPSAGKTLLYQIIAQRYPVFKRRNFEVESRITGGGGFDFRVLSGFCDALAVCRI